MQNEILVPNGTVYLDEAFATDLIKMWSERHTFSDRTLINMRRWLSTIAYDQENVRSWRNQLAVWRANKNKAA